MFRRNWHDILRRGLYDAELSRSALSRGASDVYNGTARLRWTAGKGIRITASPNGDTDDFFGISCGGEGGIIPRTSLFRMEGWTLDGWKAEAGGLCSAQKYYKILPLGISWNLGCEQIELREESPPLGPRPYLKAVLEPIYRMKFTGISDITDRNSHEFREEHPADWMIYETSFGRVFLRNLGQAGMALV